MRLSLKSFSYCAWVFSICLVNASVMDCVSSAFCFASATATASAMVLASAVSLAASQFWLWSLLAEVASPSLVLSLFPITFVVRIGVSVQNECVFKQNSVHFHTLFSSVVQVLDDLDSNCLFKSHFKSTKINSLLMSPICCGCSRWSQKKSEYLKSS